MTKNILIISSSHRRGGNSEILCDRFMQGALEARHHVEKIRLADHNIRYCTGCGACNATQRCVQQDDMADILKKLAKANVVVLSTPVYFYTCCGLMKSFIDRTVPLWRSLKNKEFYVLMTAADENPAMLQRTLECFRGWYADCLDDSKEKGVVYGTGAWEKGSISNTPAYNQAYEMGKKA